MGAFISRRVGTDPYYASYEKAFERLEKESSKILDRRVKRRRTMDQMANVGFWLTSVTLCIALLIAAYLQQVESRSWINKTATILGALALPALSVLLHRGVQSVLRWREVKDERFLKKLMDSKRKMVKELKDSTRFDRTMALIKKYDPDEQALNSSPRARDIAAGANGLRRRPSVPRTQGAPTTPDSSTGAMIMRPAAVAATAAANAAAGVAAGTGKMLMPMFEQLASNLIADNPVLMEEARRAHQEAQSFKHENSLLRQQLDDLKTRMDNFSSSSPDREAGKAAAAAAPAPAANGGSGALVD